VYIQYMKKLANKTHNAYLKYDSGYSNYIHTGQDGTSSFGMKYSHIREICYDPLFQRIDKDDISTRQRKLKEGVFTKEMKMVLDNKPGKRGQTSLGKLDQFFTKPEIAKQCWVDLHKYAKKYISDNDFYVEPSAGSGSFFNLMPIDTRAGFDICPMCDGVEYEDFLKYDFSNSEYNIDGRNVISVGNPPFGKNSSVAVQFFNRCAVFANIIAFIVPRTFNKVSLQNKLDLHFHLIKSIPLKDDSFFLGKESYKVPCCFQIWIKKSELRQRVELSLENNMFDFIKKMDFPDLAVRRVGGTTGHCTKDIESCKDHSYYFLKVKMGSNPYQIMEHINKLHSAKRFLKVVSQSAGVRSMSRGEFIKVLNEYPLDH